MAMSGTKFYVTFLSVLVPCILRQFYLLEIVEVVLREIVFVVFLCCSSCFFPLIVAVTIVIYLGECSMLFSVARNDSRFLTTSSA